MLFSYFINCFSKDTPKRFFGFAAVQRRIVWEVFFRISVTCWPLTVDKKREARLFQRLKFVSHFYDGKISENA